MIPMPLHSGHPQPCRRARLLPLLLLAGFLAGCAAPREKIALGAPTTVRPRPAVAPDAQPTGSIFLATGFQPLFEDRKPRRAGDLLTIQINENLNASQTANSTTARTNDVGGTIPKVSGVLGMAVPGLSAKASTSNTFGGKGQTASTGLFTGTITVTVIEVLANGNLLVAGEKQIGIRQNSEVLKFSGVVDPAQIQPGNTISSTQVADARLDYRGGGNVEEAQTQGWLSQFFNSWMPF